MVSRAANKTSTLGPSSEQEHLFYEERNVHAIWSCEHDITSGTTSRIKDLQPKGASEKLEFLLNLF